MVTEDSVTGFATPGLRLTSTGPGLGKKAEGCQGSSGEQASGASPQAWERDSHAAQPPGGSGAVAEERSNSNTPTRGSIPPIRCTFGSMLPGATARSNSITG